MKAAYFRLAGWLLVSALALGLTHVFISSALADSGCSSSTSGGDETVTCTNTSDNDVTTANGDDTVTIDNSDVSVVSTGNGNDLIQSTGPSTSHDFILSGGAEGLSTIDQIDAGDGNNTVSVDNTIVGNAGKLLGEDTLISGIQAGSGNDSIAIDHSFVINVLAGTGDNTLTVTNGSAIGETTMGNGDDQVTVGGVSLVFSLDTGGGDDTVLVEKSSGAVTVVTGDGNDSIETNDVTSSLDAGDGNDTVTIQGHSSATFVPTSELEGGDGYDVLTFKFTVGSQKQKDTFDSLVKGDASFGSVRFGGHNYAWTNFEELTFLLKIAAASGNNDVSVSVLSDSRLNNRDMAAPIAIYCKAGQVEGWVIDPATGNGNEQFVAPISAFPTSSNGVDGSLNGDQAIITYGGYSYGFPVASCP